MRRNLVTELFCALLMCVFVACEEDEQSWSVQPTVKTGDVVSVASNTATLEGSVTDAADQRINGYGIIYSEDSYFDPAGGYEVDRKVASVGSSSEKFSVTLTGLTAMYTYYYCAYVDTDNGTFYGNVKNFVTVPAMLNAPTTPVVVSKEEQNIFVSTTLDFDGSSEGYELGFCWKTVRSDYSEPTLENCDNYNQNHNVNEYTMGFLAEEDDAIYAVRAYARSYQTDETVYSETMYVTLQDTPLVSPVQPQTTGTQEGTVFWAMAINFDGMNITEQGFCYSETTSSPTVDDAAHKVADTTTEDLERIEAVISGISSDDFYYVRAYCVADGVTYYGPTYIYGTREAGIYTLEDLIAFRNARNNYENDMSMWKNDAGEINLYSDIDMGTVGHWIPIRELYSDETFKGNGHTLNNLTITVYDPDVRFSDGNMGLFALNAGGTITDLHIDAGSRMEIVVPSDYNSLRLGAICGTNEGTISNCTSAASVVASSESNSANIYVSGIAAENRGTIENCTNAGIVDGWSTGAYVGGISSYAYNASFIGCVNTGAVGIGHQCYMLGGIVAYAYDRVNASGCVNQGAVTAHNDTENVGGIFGYCYDSESSISQCNNSGAISGGKGTVGGIAGFMSGAVTQCINEGDITSDADNIGTICGNQNTVNNFIDNQNTGLVNGGEGSMIGIDLRPPLVGEVTIGTVTATSVELTAQVLDTGGGEYTRKGFYISTEESSFGDSYTMSDDGTNQIFLTVEGLNPGTRYFVRAFAGNSYGSDESEPVSFTTPL